MTVTLPDRATLGAALVDAWPELAGRAEEVRVVRAPGRVNLIGEHTDYNEGFVLPAAIDLEIRLAYLPTDDGRVELLRTDTGVRGSIELDEDRAAAGDWLDYVYGTAWALREAGHRVTGLRGVIASDLPENAGLSSSAAIELVSAWAMLGDAAEAIEPLALARLCQRAENEYVGVRSGLMDQFAEACGVAGAALLLDCRTLDWRAVELPPDTTLVVCHTGSPRRLGSSEYNLRREQCEAAVAELARDDPSIRSLRDVSVERLQQAAAAGRLEPTVLRRAEHVVAENVRVHATVAAFAAGDLLAIRALFAASHASLRDLYEVSSPELDALVDIAAEVRGVVGARMTGAGFGGCTVNLVRPDAVERLQQAIEREYPQRTGLTPRVIPVTAAAGAGRLE